MKNLITIIVLMASLCFSQDKVWGTFSDLKWTGEGKDKVASWAGGPIANTWWDGLELTSVWPMDEGSGAVLYDKLAGKNATWEGTDATWKTINGLVCIYGGKESHGTAVFRASIPDRSIYNLNTNSMLVGCWLYRPWAPLASLSYFGKGSSSITLGNYGLRDSGNENGTLGYYAKPGATAVSDYTVRTAYNEWVHVIVAIDRYAKFVSCWTNGFFAAGKSYPADSGNVTNNNPFCLFNNSGSLSETYLAGSARDFFVKVNGTTNDIPIIYNATRAVYGK